MIEDKLIWAGAKTLSGMGFVIWGILNIGVFGLSKIMHKENFDYHFAYRGEGKFTQPLKALMASEKLENVAWTAPSLILGGYYLQSKVGSLTAFKIFGLTIMASYLATCTLGPASAFSDYTLRAYSPVRFDSIALGKQPRMVGADLVAGTLLYTCLFANGYFIPGLAFAAFDAAYYGPMGIAMPASGLVAAVTLL